MYLLTKSKCKEQNKVIRKKYLQRVAGWCEAMVGFGDYPLRAVH